MNKKCLITNEHVIDDCHIRIEFGYGSDLDLTTYEFSAVSDQVGKAALQAIQQLMTGNQSVEQFSRDVTEETFGL